MTNLNPCLILRIQILNYINVEFYNITNFTTHSIHLKLLHHY